MKAYLGDVVRTKRHGFIGKVYKKDHFFEDSQEWFDRQIPPIPQKAKREKWYHLLCDKGGSIYVPESDILSILSKKEAAKFSNPWESFHFRTK